jgi:hypothetical protein
VLRTEGLTRAFQRPNVQRLLGTRSAWLVPALLIVVCGIALIWFPRRGAPAPALQEREASTAVQAASPSPVSEIVPPAVTDRRDLVAPPVLEASDAGAPLSSDPDTAPAPARRSRKARAPSPRDPQTPFGKMSVAMGQAGARIAGGGSQRSGARPAPAATAQPPRAAATKAPKAAPTAPVEPWPRHP